jgi:hypothetical protein
MNDQAIPELDPLYWGAVDAHVSVRPMGELTPLGEVPAWPQNTGSSVAPKGDWTRVPVADSNEGFPLFIANWLTYLSEVVGCLECELRHQSLI